MVSGPVCATDAAGAAAGGAGADGGDVSDRVDDADDDDDAVDATAADAGSAAVLKESIVPDPADTDDAPPPLLLLMPLLLVLVPPLLLPLGCSCWLVSMRYRKSRNATLTSRRMVPYPTFPSLIFLRSLEGIFEFDDLPVL